MANLRSSETSVRNTLFDGNFVNDAGNFRFFLRNVLLFHVIEYTEYILCRSRGVFAK